MRLDRVTPDKDCIRLIFSDGANHVEKTARISDCARAVNSGPLTAEAALEIRRKAREAERDLAYMKHGKDWQKHVSVQPGGFWSAESSHEELELIKSAVEMLRAT